MPLCPAFPHIGPKMCSDRCFIQELGAFEVKPEEMFAPIYNYDETLAHHFTAETKKQSKQWAQEAVECRKWPNQWNLLRELWPQFGDNFYLKKENQSTAEITATSEL